MSPGWSHSLSSFGFQAFLLSNKVTFHNSTLPWNTRRPHKYTSTCICSALKSTNGWGVLEKITKTAKLEVECRQQEFVFSLKLTPRKSECHPNQAKDKRLKMEVLINEFLGLSIHKIHMHHGQWGGYCEGVLC